MVSQIPKRIRYKKRKRQQKQIELTSDLVAVGDQVTVTLNEDGSGTIESVAPRRSVLSRARPAANGRQVSQDREQVMVANPDQVVLVFSIAQPEPSLRKLDRLLVVTELNELPTVICVNKMDLSTPEAARAKFNIYKQLGYTLVFTSVLENTGIDELRALLKDKLSVFAGSSGVGKTSLLNTVQPELGLKVGRVSDATTKGMHTTRHSELIALEMGGYVADTPGIRGVAIFDIEASELDGYFREIAPHVAGCEFSDCTHSHERKCAVIAAVESGEISPERYDSYLRLWEEHTQLNRAQY